MTKLLDLRRRLARLRRRRLWIRRATAYSTLALAVLCIAGVAFAVDWIWELDVWQRGLMLLGAAAAVVWAAWRWVFPWLGWHETDLDMALLVERQNNIDSDLIAAVQFEWPEAADWGSKQLEQAVIDNVAFLSPRLNVLKAVTLDALKPRLKWLIVVAALWLVMIVAAPRHVATFARRMCLSSAHYPTATQIIGLKVNGREVNLAYPGDSTVRVYYGQPVEFEVICAGQLPAEGRIELVSLQSGLRSSVELTDSQSNRQQGQTDALDSPNAVGMEKPGTLAHEKSIFAASQPPNAAEAKTAEAFSEAPSDGTSGVYIARVPRLVEDAKYQVQIGVGWSERPWRRWLGFFVGSRRGKAWTDFATITVSQLPVIQIDHEVYPPTYAVKSGSDQPGEQSGPIRLPQGMRQISVVEGSRVVLRLYCDKYLQQATATIGAEEYPFEQVVPTDSSDRRDQWVLDSPACPLANVLEPIRYAVQVVDGEGQSLQQPIEGLIRIQADSPPRIGAGSIIKFVLPNKGRPTIYYQASDDYGIDQITANWEVQYADGRQSESGQIPIYKLPPGERPQQKLSGEFPFELARLPLAKSDDKSSGKLSKGDVVRVILQATDYRGRNPGRQAEAEAVVFQVTDEQGILANMAEDDRRALQQIKTMIQRQLGIGESP